MQAVLKNRHELTPCIVQGIMRVACLFDGTAWGLVMPDHLYALGTANVMANEKVHAALLDAYLEKHPSFAAIPDDGYIMQVGATLFMAARTAQCGERCKKFCCIFKEFRVCFSCFECHDVYCRTLGTTWLVLGDLTT